MMELQTCPFCGERPRLTVRPDDAEATAYFAAVACYCGGYSACAHKMARAPEADEAERLAREAWNTRPGVAAAVAEERAKWEPAARRYEIVRRMSVPAFQDAFVLNRRTGKPFDEIIDELAPVYLTAGPAPKTRGKKRPTAPI